MFDETYAYHFNKNLSLNSTFEEMSSKAEKANKEVKKTRSLYS